MGNKEKELMSTSKLKQLYTTSIKILLSKTILSDSTLNHPVLGSKVKTDEHESDFDKISLTCLKLCLADLISQHKLLRISAAFG